MDHAKLDAPLAAALAAAPEPDARSLSVLVHVDPAAADHERLARMGVRGGGQRTAIRTATLSPAQIAELSDQPWVRQVRLSTPLRLQD
jgi:hypothetical protein